MAEFSNFGEYRYSEKKGAATALTFLFIGVGIGTVLALLFAPKTGKQMRRTIRRRYEDARDVIDDVSDRAGEFVDRGRDWADVAREKVAPIAKRMRRD
jgi:gas vesicle protein